MASRLKAKIKPELLQWARETAGYSVAAAAIALKISEELLGGWEAGNDAPSVAKLRQLAELYKRPLAVFYLPKAPLKFMPMRDFRRLPGTAMLSVPPSIVIEERRARQRRELAIELAGDLGTPIPEFTLSASLDEDPEIVGARVREQLGVTAEKQRRWRDAKGHDALRAWIELIEAKGILVFQSDKFSSEEASGFAIWESIAPAIVIARKGTLPRRRTFSLLHEFAHLLVRASGLSDLDIEGDVARPPEEQRIEVFCNAVAAATLIPKHELLAQNNVKAHPLDLMEWTDVELTEIAKSFGVSQEAVLRRLLTFRRTTARFYQVTRQRYLEEWVQFRERERAAPSDKGIPRNMPQEALSTLGRPLVGMLLERYHQEHLSLSEVAGYLGLKVKHVGKIDQMMRGAR
ncbi:XRE family transcriptional regulator [Stenotrophomonas rhizophila]|uniref:XRE family transcriptional regulator n=1 Tax=Stenotrophomonas rhizophila TaxID=216778 RepID=UPI000B88D7C6|nr:XRE family transcriptional regulator [Stenotrophomonas rhizophila]